jgi:ferredoxin
MNAPFRALIADVLGGYGLHLRGAWEPQAIDALPVLANGKTAAVVWMVGGVGSSQWPAFSASSFYADGLPDPLDRWSRAIAEELAQHWGGLALFPFEGPPYWPFQQWAARAETLDTSPLMLRLHPTYGLWHAYRFALALPAVSPGDTSFLTASSGVASAGADVCVNCSGQPCLQACPVQAFDAKGYQLDACATHLQSPQGQDCMQAGCLARRACPVGTDYVYEPAHAAFHMQAFAGSH